MLPRHAVASPHWVCMEAAAGLPQLLPGWLGQRKSSPTRTKWGDATARRTLQCVRTLSPREITVPSVAVVISVEPSDSDSDVCCVGSPGADDARRTIRSVFPLR